MAHIDLVALIVEAPDNNGSAGIAYLISPTSKSGSGLTYTTMRRHYLRDRTLAHEFGHNMGLEHDRANAWTTPFRPYAYGYTLPNRFYTIMAYACTGCARIEYFSNPAVSYNGFATGVADFADEARVWPLLH